MAFFETLRKGIHNIVTNIKKDMAARAVENKEIKGIEQKAAFAERKNQAVKTAKYRVQLKGKKDREIIKNPNKNTFGTGTQPGNMFDLPQTKDNKQKKPSTQTESQPKIFDVSSFKY